EVGGSLLAARPGSPHVIAMDLITILRELERAWEAGSLPGRQTAERNAALRELLWPLQQQPTTRSPDLGGFRRPTATLDRRAQHLALKLATDLIEHAIADLVLLVELGRDHFQERHALCGQERTRELHDRGDLAVGERERRRRHDQAALSRSMRASAAGGS